MLSTTTSTRWSVWFRFFLPVFKFFTATYTILRESAPNGASHST